MAGNRSKVEAYILKLMKAMDPSGFNVNYYKDLFAKLTDQMFDQWMKRMKSGETKLYFYAPNMKVFPTVEQFMKAAEITGTQYFERAKIWDEATRRYYMTPHSHLVLKLPVRRLKQYLMGKISIPENDRLISNLTGQVIKPDKGSSISMTEAQTLDSKGLHKCLVEFTNIRGGNIEAYNTLRSELIESGRASFNDLTNGGIRSTEVAQAFLTAMHLENNLAGGDNNS